MVLKHELAVVAFQLVTANRGIDAQHIVRVALRRS
jgi:hypothetical protein